jgi:uncharacterized pyridoxamine 5'-phosphate oxidase family protein
MMWFADKDGFYFSTSKTSNAYRQRSANPKLEPCFYAPPAAPQEQGPTMDMGKEMRITGVAEFIDDRPMNERLLNERPFMRPFTDITIIFRVTKGEAWFWTLVGTGRESAIERVRF